MAWKPPAIPDINEKSVLAALAAIKEILEMRNGMRGSLEAVSFVKVWNMADCPAGSNCIDRFNNVLIRGSLNINGVDFTCPESETGTLYRKTLVGQYDILFHVDFTGGYSILAGKDVQGVYSILAGRRAQGVYDILAGISIQGVYGIQTKASIQGVYDTLAGKQSQGVYDILAGASIQGVYEIMDGDQWGWEGDRDVWGDEDKWSADF